MKTESIVATKNLGKGFHFDNERKKIDVDLNDYVDNETVILNGDGKLSAKNKSSDLDLSNIPTKEFEPTDHLLVLDDGKIKKITTALQELVTDVRLGLVATKNQLGEGDGMNLIYSITNAGTATAASLRLELSQPNKPDVQYGSPVISKDKSGEVNQVSSTQFSIANLQAGGAVTITIPVTYQHYGSYVHTAEVQLSGNNIEASTEDNRASVQVDVTAISDLTYQSSQNCPAVQVKDIENEKMLLLFTYGEATRVIDSDGFQMERQIDNASLKRANIYAPDTKTIRLHMPEASTVSVQAKKWQIITDDPLQHGLKESQDGVYTYGIFDFQSTAYEHNGEVYWLKGKEYQVTKSNGRATSYAAFPMTGIGLDLLTSNATNLAGITVSFDEQAHTLTLSNLTEGMWISVNMRPQGEHCQWQSTTIIIPKKVTEIAPQGLGLTLTEGQSEFFQKFKSMEKRSASGYVSINNTQIQPQNIVALSGAINEKGIISVASGTQQRFVLQVMNGKLDPNRTTSGNVSITPNPEGTQLTVLINQSATRADSFIYSNNGINLSVNVDGGLSG